MVRDARMGIYLSVVKGVGNVVIANNTFSGLHKGGIVGHRWKEAVTGDLLKEGAGKFKTLQLDGNKVS